MRRSGSSRSGICGIGGRAHERALPPSSRRDIRIALRAGGGALIGVLFFLTVVVLIPFAIGPDLNLLARIGPGDPVDRRAARQPAALDRLFQADHEDGSLDLILDEPDAAGAGRARQMRWRIGSPPACR